MSSLPPSSFPPMTPTTTKMDTGGAVSDHTGITAIFATSPRPDSVRMSLFKGASPPLSRSPSPSLHTSSLSFHDGSLSSSSSSSAPASSTFSAAATISEESDLSPVPSDDELAAPKVVSTKSKKPRKPRGRKNGF